MSTRTLVDYYSGLLIIQYLGKPKAKATIETMAAPIIMPQTSVQEIEFSSIPISGDFVLSYGGEMIAAINWDDTEGDIQTKLQALTALATVTVVGSPADGLISVTMTGVPPPALLLVLESSTLATAIDGGFADTVTFGNTLEPGGADSPVVDFIDGGDAFGTGAGVTVTISISETDETLPLAVQSGFNLFGPSPAVGAQLDVIGKYVGVTRTGVGFNGQITLSDADFLTLIRIAIIRNAAQSSLAAIQELLFRFFPTTSILVFDYQNMRLSYLISTAFGSLDLIQLFVTEGLLPKPMAVQLASIIYVPDITNFFGYRTYTAPAVNARPFNSYTDYDTDRPWLSYADAIVS